MKIFTSYVKTTLFVVCFTLVNFCFSQKSGTWSASGSGASTSWSATAGTIDITATTTSYGSGTAYTLNDFVTYDTMGCNNSAYSDATIVGNPSLSIRHTFPNIAQITFNFSAAVENPVMHFDRLGGGQVSNLTSSSVIKIITPDITFTELSENDTHFVTTSNTVRREAGQAYTSLPSECGPPLAGTASGSVRLNGVFNTVTFEISMDAVGGNSTINDRWEIAFSEVQRITLDFDGVDDYIDRTAFLGNKSEATMMSWIKLDAAFNGGEVMGQRNFRIFVDSSRRLKVYIRTNGLSSNYAINPNSNSPVLNTELWYHVAAIYNASDGSIKLYLNGELEWEYNHLVGSAIINQASWNSNHNFEIGRNTQHDNNYFEGSIYETRVYNKALTDNQLQRQIYQEIENNGGIVRGKVIPKDIEGLNWSDLELYYKMDILNTGQTKDDSVLGVNGNLHNMRTYQDRTAPLPYVTKNGGDSNWDNRNNWLHGDVWDIVDNHTACAIVKITKDLVTDQDHGTVGLIIDNDVELTVNNDSGIQNSWYLALNGEIDLQGESQLVQNEESELLVGANGKLERDQQGTKDMFTYNYWSSPVGVTSMLENNVSYKYELPNVIQNGMNPNSPNAISFVNGYNGSISGSNISIAKHWIWKFANQADDDYSAWQYVGNTAYINPGEGFTMKGVTNTNGNVSEEQNYVFKGKPNNGNIALDLDANNDYLVGNPYPSAIDAQQFIIDNGPTIEGTGNTTGTLYFWEHWGGGSHVLSEYQGGYALYNLSGATAAASKADVDEDLDQGGPSVGAKTPGRYIPVGQGFFVVGETTGKIKFNNGQRVFKKEGNSSSVFMRGNSKNAIEEDNADSDNRMRIRLGLNSANTMHRQLLVTVDERATIDYDWGFDGKLNEDQIDDMYWMIHDEKYVIQGIDEINEIETILPLGIKSNTNGINSITIDDLENVPTDLQIFLHDKDEDVYHDLRSTDYTFILAIGEYLNRFEVVFSVPESLSAIDNELNELSLYYAIDRHRIVILNPSHSELKNVELYNIEGQSVYKNDNLWVGSYNEYEVNNLSTGTYVVKLSTADNKTITKKIIVM
jgi:hypothetical protein